MTVSTDMVIGWIGKGIIVAFPCLVIWFVINSARRFAENFETEWARFVRESGAQIIEPSAVSVSSLAALPKIQGKTTNYSVYRGIMQFFERDVPAVFLCELLCTEAGRKYAEDRDSKNHVLTGRLYCSWSTLSGPAFSLHHNSSANSRGVINALGGLFSKKQDTDRGRVHEEEFYWSPEPPPLVSSAWADPVFRERLLHVYREASKLEGFEAVTVNQDGVTVAFALKSFGTIKPSVRSIIKALRSHRTFKDMRHLVLSIPRL